MNRTYAKPPIFAGFSNGKTPYLVVQRPFCVSPDEDRLFEVELLTVNQVAKWARVSPKSVYHWIEEGKLPVVKFEKRTYRILARAVIEQLTQ